MKTVESIRILLSLFVTIKQNYDALGFYESYLSEEVLNHPQVPSRKEYNVDEAIIESLWFQIILKSCSFLEEWDSFLAVKTNKVDQQRVLLIKKVVAPARKEIGKWKDLKKFRNEVIAHNLRNSNKSFSLDDMHTYNCPNTTEELYYLVSYLERMITVLTTNFGSKTVEVTALAFQALSKERKYLHARTSKELKKGLSQVDELISKNIWSVPMHTMITDLSDQID